MGGKRSAAAEIEVIEDSIAHERIISSEMNQVEMCS